MYYDGEDLVTKMVNEMDAMDQEQPARIAKNPEQRDPHFGWDHFLIRKSSLIELLLNENEEKIIPALNEWMSYYSLNTEQLKELRILSWAGITIFRILPDKIKPDLAEDFVDPSHVYFIREGVLPADLTHRITVIKAFLQGATLEFKRKDEKEWRSFSSSNKKIAFTEVKAGLREIKWNWDWFDFQIKKEDEEKIMPKETKTENSEITLNQESNPTPFIEDKYLVLRTGDFLPEVQDGNIVTNVLTIDDERCVSRAFFKALPGTKEIVGYAYPSYGMITTHLMSLVGSRLVPFSEVPSLLTSSKDILERTLHGEVQHFSEETLAKLQEKETDRSQNSALVPTGLCTYNENKEVKTLTGEIRKKLKVTEIVRSQILENQESITPDRINQFLEVFPNRQGKEDTRLLLEGLAILRDIGHYDEICDTLNLLEKKIRKLSKAPSKNEDSQKVPLSAIAPSKIEELLSHLERETGKSSDKLVLEGLTILKDLGSYEQISDALRRKDHST